MMSAVGWSSATPGWLSASLMWTRPILHRPQRAYLPPVWSPPPAPPLVVIVADSLPPPAAWSLCLACDSELEGVPFSRRTGLCQSCHRTNDTSRLSFYAMAMAFWRKMHRTGFRRSMFTTAPSPWQVTLLRLAQILLGFRSTLTSIGTPREGADVKLSTSPEDLRAMMSGAKPMSTHVRQRLATIGHQWFRDLRAMERDEDEDEDLDTEDDDA